METTKPPERTVPRQSDEQPAAATGQPPPPTPTQAEADELKQQAHGETAPPGEGATTAPVNTAVPHVSGTGAVGATLNCTMGTWDGEPTGYAYDWMRDGASTSATGADYIVVAGDAGHSLTCVVTATNAAGSTAAPPSNAVSVPAARAANPAQHR
jgi:hypothetical protein